MKVTIVMGFFLPVPPLAGGATEKIWLRLGELMAAEGHDVTIISRRWPGLPARELHGRLEHRRVGGIRHTRWLPLNLLLDFLWGCRVLPALPTGDIVVCNTVLLPVFLRYIRPAAGRVAVVLGRMPKGQGRLYGGVDLVLATSTAVANKARAENKDLADRIFQFPNPIDWDLHAAAAVQGDAGRPITIAYVGRIHPEKGLEQLLDAAVMLAKDPGLPRWRVRLVGPVDVAQGGGGPAYRDGLIRSYQSALGDRLEVVPPVFDADALARIYGETDVFCYPSLAAHGEGLSIAPIEAMAAGSVPVVSQLECYRDLIAPGINGYQFDQTKASARSELAGILHRLLDDPALRRRAAQEAQATARRFDYAQTTQLLLDRFARLTASGTRR